MRKFGNALVKFLKNEDGPTAVEYAVMLALIIVVCITAITTLGTNANNTFSFVAGKVAPTGQLSERRTPLTSPGSGGSRRGADGYRFQDLNTSKGRDTMKKFGNALVKFLKNEDGPTAVEYAVMLALIIVVCITAITTLGTNANNTFSFVAGKVAPTGS